MPNHRKSTMHVGVCRIWLVLPENGSLKDKRQVLRSVMQRVRNKFSVAIAEVAAQDEWLRGCLGITTVSESARHANEVLSKVVAFIEESRLDAEVLDYELMVQQY